MSWLSLPFAGGAGGSGLGAPKHPKLVLWAFSVFWVGCAQAGTLGISVVWAGLHPKCMNFINF